MRRVLSVLAAVALLTTTLASATAASEFDATGSYLVVLEDGTGNVRGVAAELAVAHGGQVGFVYEHALQGFSIRVPARAVPALARNPLVKYVEADMERSIDAQAVPTGIQRIFADDNTDLDIDGSDDYRVDVDVAVIDTGVDLQHPDLNVQTGVTCISNFFWRPATCLEGGDDDHYHGTHVAGTIGALDNGVGVVGVAPGARIWPVKVLNSRGSGYTSWIVAGIDWVAAHAGTIEVANMSLGGSGYSSAEYEAIQGAVHAGVAFAVSAGNSDADASNYSPAGFDNVLSVSALADFDGQPGGLGAPTCRTDQDDTLADFSNWGPAVDIAAPGVCIVSTFPVEQGSYGTISGTSMASPHVAGALALLASVDDPQDSADVFALYGAVTAAGNSNWTDDSGDGVEEPLLDVTGFMPALVATGSGGTDLPPSVAITNPADGATVSGPVTVTAAASDDVGVTGVEFFVGGSSIGMDTDGTDGWSATWDTTADGNGSYVLEAVATDTAGQTGDDSVTVTVDNGGGTTYPIDLSVSFYKLKGAQRADLAWTGATSVNVDVHRDGTLVVTTANDGAYTDVTGAKGGGSATYKVCETGTNVCSAEVSGSW